MPIFRLDEFELDTERYELRRSGAAMTIERLPMNLLVLLAERRGELVERPAITERLWGAEVFKDTENGINTAIRKIRLVLGDNPLKPRFVQTVIGKGYRLSGVALDGAAASRVLVVVLPFENLSGDSSQDWFCEGLTDEAGATLGTAAPERIAVIARTTAQYYRQASVRQIAAELAADYVLEGSLRLEGGHIRVIARLIRGADETVVWAEGFERNGAAVLRIQKELAAALVREILPALSRQQRQRLSRRQPHNASAQDAYLRGRFFWYRRMHLEPGFCALHGIGADDFNRCRLYFEQALEHDPLYALGYSGLSNYYGSASVHGVLAPGQGWPLALSAARHAIECDPLLPEAHHALAAVHFFDDWDLPRAEAGFRRAIELNPSHPETRRLYSRVLGALGRVAEAREHSSLSERLDPLAFRGSRAVSLFWAGHYEEAISEFHAVGAHHDVPPLIHQVMAMALESTGRFGEAIAATVKSLANCGEPERADQIDAAWRGGGYGAVQEFYLEDLLKRRAAGYTSPLPIAEVCARLDRRDDALAWLDVALADRSSRLCEVGKIASFRRYHVDAGFQAFLARVEEARRLEPTRVDVSPAERRP